MAEPRLNGLIPRGTRSRGAPSSPRAAPTAMRETPHHNNQILTKPAIWRSAGAASSRSKPATNADQSFDMNSGQLLLTKVCIYSLVRGDLNARSGLGHG